MLLPLDKVVTFGEILMFIHYEININMEVHGT